MLLSEKCHPNMKELFLRESDMISWSIILSALRKVQGYLRINPGC